MLAVVKLVGEGSINVEMVFMADVQLPCETCNGKRFKKELLEVAFAGKIFTIS
jgi:excinuclease ABC subunit A